MEKTGEGKSSNNLNEERTSKGESVVCDDNIGSDNCCNEHTTSSKENGSDDSWNKSSASSREYGSDNSCNESTAGIREKDKTYDSDDGSMNKHQCRECWPV